MLSETVLPSFTGFSPIMISLTAPIRFGSFQVNDEVFADSQQKNKTKEERTKIKEKRRKQVKSVLPAWRQPMTGRAREMCAIFLIAADFRVINEPVTSTLSISKLNLKKNKNKRNNDRQNESETWRTAMTSLVTGLRGRGLRWRHRFRRRPISVADSKPLVR